MNNLVIKSIDDIRKLSPENVLGTILGNGTSVAGMRLPDNLEDYEILPSTVRGLIHNTVGFILVFDPKRGMLELLGGKMQPGESVLETLQREVFQEAGVTKLENRENIGIVLEFKPPSKGKRPRVKVAYGIKAYAPGHVAEWGTPNFSYNEILKGMARVIVPTIEEVRRILHFSGSTKMKRDALIAAGGS